MQHCQFKWFINAKKRFSWCYVSDMSDSSLNTVAGQIGHQWMEVGYSLGFTKAELENIEHDYTRLIDITPPC